jgi:hypothetical protein
MRNLKKEMVEVEIGSSKGTLPEGRVIIFKRH